MLSANGVHVWPAPEDSQRRLRIRSYGSLRRSSGACAALPALSEDSWLSSPPALSPVVREELLEASDDDASLPLPEDGFGSDTLDEERPPASEDWPSPHAASAPLKAKAVTMRTAHRRCRSMVGILPDDAIPLERAYPSASAGRKCTIANRRRRRDGAAILARRGK